MGVDPISLAVGGMLGGALLGGGASIYAGNKQAKAAEKSMAMQQEQAQKLAVEQQQQYNKLNPKKPNVRALQAQNTDTGLAQTDLTGLANLLGSTNTLGGINILDLILSQGRNTGLGK